MRTRKIIQSAIVVLGAMVLAACGGGGGGSSTVSGFSKGVITAKGSVTVNGIKFETSPGIVKVEDSGNLNDDRLKVGMVVKIKGLIDNNNGTGTANAIEYTDNLQGKVEALDPATGTFSVLGQTVKTSASTIFDDFAGAAIANGNIVEVSGLPDGSGAIMATRIELKTGAGAAEDFEVKGTVSGYSGGATFILTPPNGSDIAVTIGTATLPAGFKNGDFVEVKMATTAVGATVTAKTIQLEDELKPDANEHMEVKGLVTDLNLGAKTFKVNGILVDAAAVTLPAGLANGKEVEVEGPANSAGTIIASKVKLELEKNLLLEGDVTAKGAASLTLLGKAVNVNSGTIFKDSSAAKVPNFSLADISAGNHVQVVGFEDAGVITITKVERMDASTVAMLKGVVTAKAGDLSNFTILGVSVATDGTATEYRDAADAAMTRVGFYGALVTNTTVVKARWNTFTALTAVANRVEIEL